MTSSWFFHILQFYFIFSRCQQRSYSRRVNYYSMFHLIGQTEWRRYKSAFSACIQFALNLYIYRNLKCVGSQIGSWYSCWCVPARVQGLPVECGNCVFEWSRCRLQGHYCSLPLDCGSDCKYCLCLSVKYWLQLCAFSHRGVGYQSGSRKLQLNTCPPTVFIMPVAEDSFIYFISIYPI